MASTRTSFQHEIHNLYLQIAEMATEADLMLKQAIEALTTGNLDLVQVVIDADDTVDRFDVEIESKCLLLIAKEQPVAADLRIIGTALKIISDIERIGDYAVDIAKIGRRMARALTLYQPLVDLPHLAQLSHTMLQEAVQAFVNHDMALAEKVIHDDDAVDSLYHGMRGDLTHILITDPTRGLLVLNVLFAAKYLERVSDHVVNIAERVHFVETGALYRPKKDEDSHDSHV